MFNKKSYLLNCNVCDTRKIKEEDYSGYEKMMINANVVVVSASSKSVLNRLPVTINQDSTIEIPDDIDVEIKTINGSYEITGTTAVQDHTLLIVNGSLNIHSGTEGVLEKYEKINVNGSVRCPKSLEGYLAKLSANGSVSIYPDDCVILDSTFIVDKYFPLRVKEGKKYYVESKVIIQDKTVDLEKLVQKKVQFITEQLIVPEEMVESCVELFDEKELKEYHVDQLTFKKKYHNKENSALTPEEMAELERLERQDKEDAEKDGTEDKPKKPHYEKRNRGNHGDRHHNDQGYKNENHRKTEEKSAELNTENATGQEAKSEKTTGDKEGNGKHHRNRRNRHHRRERSGERNNENGN